MDHSGSPRTCSVPGIRASLNGAPVRPLSVVSSPPQELVHAQEHAAAAAQWINAALEAKSKARAWSSQPRRDYIPAAAARFGR